MIPSAARRVLPFAFVAGLAAAAPAQQPTTFSIDWKSVTVGTPDTAFAFPITEGDLLRPTPPAIALGPLPGPAIRSSAGFFPVPGLGLMGHAPCAGHPGSTPCIIEVDALSFGLDYAPIPGVVFANSVRFSCDEFAVGFPGFPFPPTVWTEGPVGDLATDILVDLGIGALPAPPFGAMMPGSVAFLDGNGLMPPSAFVYPGLGLVEPRPPIPLLPAMGDNVDALETGMLPASGVPPMGFFYSLDAFWPDPLTGIPNTGSAAAHGFSSAAVLNTPVPGGVPALYAAPGLLGLDFFGPGSDDLDALALAENGVAGYMPSMFPYDWAGGGTDMLLFSVRRGSAVVGMPDSIFGIPIEPGDILTTPLAPAMGGVSPFPGILIAAENLGLATKRSLGVPFGDELDALDTERLAFFDCNGNGREDAIDIALGSSNDNNNNGIPDECELIVKYSCFCPAPGVCANPDPSAGCRNSTGAGALLTATGTSSVTADNLILTTTQAPPFVPGILIQGPTLGAPVPFYDGLRCVGGALRRWPLQISSGAGTFVYGPGMVAYSVGNFAPFHWLTAGSTWHFQQWYRDPLGPCGTAANVSNVASVTFTP
jgi:hypothetical protein